MESKQSQRQNLKNIRGKIPSGLRKIKSNLIADRLFSLNEYAAADTVMIYMSYGSEVETDAIFERALADNKRVAVPRCEDGCIMNAYFINSVSQLESGSYGISEPSEKLIAQGVIVPADKNGIDLIIVPALGFDKYGYRIGYGKGYYDRFLSGYNGATVGLCFSECILSRVSYDMYDRKIDIVLTDNALYGE